MKPDVEPQPVPGSPARVEFQVRFALRGKGHRRAKEAPIEAAPAKVVSSPPELKVVASMERIPKIARLLVLAHHFERLVREGVVKDYATIARLTGLTRARVTQVVNLTLLAPEIQDAVLILPHGTRVTERSLRQMTPRPDWRTQRSLWRTSPRCLGKPSPD